MIFKLVNRMFIARDDFQTTDACIQIQDLYLSDDSGVRQIPIVQCPSVDPGKCVEGWFRRVSSRV